MKINIDIHIKKAKLGDRNAQKEIYVNFAPVVLGICKRYAKDDHQAMDYMQECFLHVFQVIKIYEFDKGNFDSWLYRVCTNKILKLLRAQRKYLVTSNTEQLTDTLEDADNFVEQINEISSDVLFECIKALPDGYREVLNLFVFEELSHKEIATALGISEVTSRSQFFKAKRLLKKSLTNKINHYDERKMA